MADDRCELLCIDFDQAERLRLARLETTLVEAAAERGRALADPTRLMLAAALSEAEELCVCDLAWIAERSQNLVSHHLRTLRGAGLVSSRRDGKMVMYSMTQAGRGLLEAVIPQPATARR